MSDQLHTISSRIPAPLRRAYVRVATSFWLSLTGFGLVLAGIGWIVQEGATAGILGIIGASMVLVGTVGYAIYLTKYAT